MNPKYNAGGRCNWKSAGARGWKRLWGWFQKAISIAPVIGGAFPPSRGLSLVVEFYYAQHQPADAMNDYIGAFQFRVPDFTPEGAPIIDPNPFMKMLIYPTTDGRVWVRKGFIRPDEEGVSSAAGQGLIDEDSVEELVATPREVGEIPPDGTNFWPTFLLVRSEGTWHISRVLHNEEARWTGLQPFATLPPAPFLTHSS